MRRVYTGGTFDLFHPGHVNFLRQCKKIGGEDSEVIVALNTDKFIEEFKGKKPICDYNERAAMLKSCKYVDKVISNWGGADSKSVIKNLNNIPDFIVIGSDWACKDYYAQMGFDQYWLDSVGITLIYIPYTRGYSSSLMKERLGL
jgi:glycerol-3-phosphate cytidylyltransferase